MELEYSRIGYTDLGDVYDMEQESYIDNPGDRPGPLMTRSFVRDCPDLTLIARDEDGKLVSAMYGCMIDGPELTNEKFENAHVPGGDTLCVYSQSIRRDLAGKKIAKQVAKYYYEEWILNGKNGYRRPMKFFSTAMDIKYVGWMNGMGFDFFGKCDIDYGDHEWFTLTRQLPRVYWNLPESPTTPTESPTTPTESPTTPETPTES